MSNPRFTIPSKAHSQEQIPMPYNECWSCGQPSNYHCGPQGPQEGEVMICLNCTDPSIFTAAGDLRAPSQEEHAGIVADPEYRSLKTVIQAANRRAMMRDPEPPNE